jgi:hypothetical protein
MQAGLTHENLPRQINNFEIKKAPDGQAGLYGAFCSYTPVAIRRAKPYLAESTLGRHKAMQDDALVTDIPDRSSRSFALPDKVSDTREQCRIDNQFPRNIHLRH